MEDRTDGIKTGVQTCGKAKSRGPRPLTGSAGVEDGEGVDPDGGGVEEGQRAEPVGNRVLLEDR